MPASSITMEKHWELERVGKKITKNGNRKSKTAKNRSAINLHNNYMDWHFFVSNNMFD